MEIVQQESIVLFLLLFVAIVAAAANRFRIPYPILLTIVGGVLGLLPVFPNIALEPDLVFHVFLPPLLFAAGWHLSWREFRTNLGSIVLLAVGLVTFTILALLAFRSVLLPGFTWQAALLLGAIIGATDAVAATAIGRRLGLPSRIVELLEAESLVNDGTGLLAFQFGLAILVSGRTPTLVEGVGRLVFLSGGGVLLGLASGFAITRIERWIDDGPIEIVMSLLSCYAVYSVAEHLHTSGVLAVIACSMLMSRESHDFMSPQVRLQFGVVWDVLIFVFNGVVFILIGLQLPLVLKQLSGVGPAALVRQAVVFCAAILGLRLLWMFTETYGAYWYRRWLNDPQSPPPHPKELIVLTWGGMRGVLSLAAATSLPFVSGANEPFKERPMILFLVFCLITASLVLQGVSMPWLIRVLAIDKGSEEEMEEQQARKLLVEAALEYLSLHRVKERFESAVIQDVTSVYQRQLESFPKDKLVVMGPVSRSERNSLVLEILRVERDVLLQLRDESSIGDETARLIQRELDLIESHIHTGARDRALI